MLRFLSVTRSAVCRRSLLLLQRVTDRLAQTHAVTAKTQPAHMNNTDPSISVFHRPTRTCIDCSDITADESTAYSQHSGQLVDVCFSNNLKKSLHDVQQMIKDEACTNGTVTAESVDELMCREIQPSHESLTRLYSRLAKLRLTGTFCAAIDEMQFYN